MRFPGRYRRLTFWNKVAFWGAVASIVGVILGVWSVFRSTTTSTPVTKAAPRPQSFDIKDPHLRFVRFYDLRKEIGARLEAGRCPKEPCFRIEVRQLRLQDDPPSVWLTLSGSYGGNQAMDWRGVGLTVPIKRGCHFSLTSRDFDMKFEVQEDQISFLRAWVAIFDGTDSREGMAISAPECPA